MAFVVLAKVIGQQALVAQTRVVYERYARNPVARIKLAAQIHHVVLATGKVPHEVAHIHVVELIAHEIFQVVVLGGSERRLGREGVDVVAHRHRLAVQIQLRHFVAVGVNGVNLNSVVVILLRLFYRGRPYLVAALMARHGGIHAREEHAKLRIIYGLEGVLLHNVTGASALSYLVVCCLITLVERRGGGGCSTLNGFAYHSVAVVRNLRILWLHHRGAAVVHGVHTVVFFLILSRVSRSVEQRCLAVLLATQIRGQVEDVVGRVLIHRGVGRRADKYQRIGGITHKYHGYGPCNDVEHAYGQAAAEHDEHHGC